MAASPKWKVYDQEGQYVASCKSPFYAAAMLCGLGIEGYTIRKGHRPANTMWTEGADGWSGESMDTTVETVLQRAEEIA